MTHCSVNDILHPAQKGCARNQLDCTDHLLLNSRIWYQVKANNRFLSVAWLDYRKAYDSVPHNWLLFCLQLFRFHPVIVQCIAHLMPLWSTIPFCSQGTISYFCLLWNISILLLFVVEYFCYSPLLFCIVLTPLSLLLDHLDGYHTRVAGQLDHLLYMDDLKLNTLGQTHIWRPCCVLFICFQLMWV